MMHRLREAMNELNPTPMGGEGSVIQADETYYGNTSKRAKGYRKGLRHKAGVVALVEPKGRARAFHVKQATAATVREILVTNVRRTSELHTDESNLYPKVGKEFAAHKTVEHGTKSAPGFYVGKDGQSTNAVENFFGNFKRSMKGTYRFCSDNQMLAMRCACAIIDHPIQNLTFDEQRRIYLQMERFKFPSVQVILDEAAANKGEIKSNVAIELTPTEQAHLKGLIALFVAYKGLGR